MITIPEENATSLLPQPGLSVVNGDFSMTEPRSVEPLKNEKRGRAERRKRDKLRHGYGLGKMADGVKYIEKRGNTLRRQLEDQVLACHGKVTMDDARLIQTACRCERAALFASHSLRADYEHATVELRLHLNRDILKGTVERDRAIAKLDIAQQAATDLAKLHAAIQSAKANDNGNGETVSIMEGK